LLLLYFHFRPHLHERLKMSSPVWLITGCSSGFGLSLALIALRSGHKVIATSRNPSKTPALVAQVEALGGVWHQLDVCSPEAELQEVLRKAGKVFGAIDILVNNAAYALLGAFETISDVEARAQMETNFFGPVTLTRLLLPQMRRQGSGTIVNISSTAGIEAKASRSLYSASKFALEAFSEALYSEVQPFNIRVLLVEPGAFGTGFAAGCVMPQKEMPVEYRGTITDLHLEGVRNLAGGKSPGDVEKGCRAIFDVVMKSGQAEGLEEFLRLPLGQDGSARWVVKLDNLRRNLDGTEKIWSNTDNDP